MRRIIATIFTVAVVLTALARTTYVVMQNAPLYGSEKWVKTNYYIWENTYTQADVDGALELTPTGKGWIGGGFESVAPFDNGVLADCLLVFDIKTTGEGELSVQLTAVNPKAAQSVKLKFERDGQWQTVRININKSFPKVCKAWREGARGYVFSIVGGATTTDRLYLRNIRYQSIPNE